MGTISAQSIFAQANPMEYRLLGDSGLKVPVLSYGTATFGGRGDFFGAWGTSDVARKFSEQIAKLDTASKTDKTYPYWHQASFSRNPFPAEKQ